MSKRCLKGVTYLFDKALISKQLAAVDFIREFATIYI